MKLIGRPLTRQKSLLVGSIGSVIRCLSFRAYWGRGANSVMLWPPRQVAFRQTTLAWGGIYEDGLISSRSLEPKICSNAPVSNAGSNTAEVGETARAKGPEETPFPTAIAVGGVLPEAFCLSNA